MLVFSTQLCELLSLTSPCQSTVCGWEGVGGIESCWRPYSAGILRSVSDQIQYLQIATPPQTKT
jgi:hypothetical protein